MSFRAAHEAQSDTGWHAAMTTAKENSTLRSILFATAAGAKAASSAAPLTDSAVELLAEVA